MNEITPSPDQNTNPNIADSTTNPEMVNPVQPNKSSKKVVLICIILFVLVGAVIAAVILGKKTYTQNKQTAGNSQNTVSESKQAKAVEQAFISPISGAKTEITKSDYYVATVADNQYYGMVSKINADYIRMAPMAYKKSGALVFSGSELHGPESVTYYQVSKITKLQKLDPANKDEASIIDAIKSKSFQVSDPFPEQNINKYIAAGQFQAYFFADGTAFFAKTTTLQGTFLASSAHVYMLRSTPLVNPTGPTSTSVSLALAKPEEYNKRTASDLLYWQNLKPDSQIVKAATQYEKQNP